MATAYTSLLGLALPVPGELTGTWGLVANNSITQLTEDAIAGSVTYDVSLGDWTLTDIDGASDSARMAILIPYGTGTTCNIIAPGQSKSFIVCNRSNISVTVKSSSTSGVSVAAGTMNVVAWNGIAFIALSSGVSLSGNNTWTGTQTFSTPAVLGTPASGDLSNCTNAVGYGLKSATTTISVSAATAPTAGQVLTATGGSAATWQTPSSSGGTVTSVAMSVPSFLSVSGSPVTSSGTLAVTLSGTALPVVNGGTGVTTSTGTGNVVLSSNPTFTGYTETVYTFITTSGSLALDPANGTVQSLAASGTITFTDSLSSGQSISLLLTNGSSYTINYPTITWVSSAGNVAPTLSSNNTLVFWKISTTLYGALVGKSA